MADLLTQIGSEWANKFGAFAGAGLLRVVAVLSGTPTDGGTHAETHLAGATGIASIDRAAVYKAMAQVKQGQIVLAFCWAHVRRDFLEVLTGYADLNDWVVSWLEEIRELYQRNDARLEVLSVPATVGKLRREGWRSPPG